MVFLLKEFKEFEYEVSWRRDFFLIGESDEDKVEVVSISENFLVIVYVVGIGE